MKKTLINFFALASLMLLAAPASWAAEEDNLISVLKGSATAPQKCAACQQLRIVGSARAVPALAEQLLNDRVSHAARYALEAMPYPEAAAALRAALEKSSGLIQAGLLDSLGWRRDTESTFNIIPMLGSNNATIAAAAASALGKIGGKDALNALNAHCDGAPAGIQPVILDSLLQCAERLLSSGEADNALIIYKKLFNEKYSFSIRTAAWRGLVLADAAHRADHLVKALSGTDSPIKMAAIRLVGELNDPQSLRSCLQKWSTLPIESQLAVLKAGLKLGAEILPTVRDASQNSQATIRIAAWQAMAGLNDSSSIPSLAKAAARGEPAERDAARDTLLRLRGAKNPLVEFLDKTDSQEKAELLRALGNRGEASASEALLQHADSEIVAVRIAALEALAKLGAPETLVSLLNLALKSQSPGQDALQKALFAVCQASNDKEKATRNVIETMDRASVAVRCQLLPLLAELGTPAALSAAQAASKSADSEVSKEGVRALSRWPDASPALGLLDLARKSDDLAFHALALRGCIDLAGQEPDAAKRLTIIQQALAAAKRIDEKKQALGQIGQIASPAALQEALLAMADSGLLNEASLAAITIAESLSKANPTLAKEAAEKILARSRNIAVSKRAWLLRTKPKSGGPFIQDWLVCGPFEKSGVAGATANFTTPFGPEISGAKLEWKPIPRNDHINLAALFPGKDNCAAFLKTEIISPEDCSAALLLGSDDGVKAWLNGVVVHSNNVDRGEVTDQDIAPITLKKGANQLMLKISQGGGGWSACARIVGADGLPIPGLRVEAK